MQEKPIRESSEPLIELKHQKRLADNDDDDEIIDGDFNDNVNNLNIIFCFS